jgi:hypothetical protein
MKASRQTDGSPSRGWLSWTVLPAGNVYPSLIAVLPAGHAASKTQPPAAEIGCWTGIV